MNRKGLFFLSLMGILVLTLGAQTKNSTVFKALDEGSLEVLKKYLAQKGSPNLTDEEGYSLLHRACMVGASRDQETSQEEVKLLTEAGADVNQRAPGEQTPVMTAVQTGDQDLVQLLLDAGADLTLVDSQGRNALMYAPADNLELWKLLVDKGCDVNLISNENYPTTPLGEALGNPELVRFLIDAGAAVTGPEKVETYLASAAALGQVETMKILVTLGQADVNEVFSTATLMNNSALMAAVRSHHLESVQFLLSQGANPDLVSINTSLVVGADGEEPPGTALILAAGEETFEIFDALMEAHADVNARDQYGQTALMEASRLGRLDFVKRLVKAGADVNGGDQYGHTALMNAAEEARVSVVQYLISQKANVNAVTRTGGTSVLRAGLENSEVTALLLQAGADPNKKLTYAETCLHLAAYAGNLAAVKLLVQAKADVNVKSSQGQTPLDMAMDQDHGDVVQFLKSKKAKTGT